MLKAKHIKNIEDINRLDNDTQMIYIGNDFCERLILDYQDIYNIYDLAIKRNLKIGLKTPFITESYIESYCRLIERIAHDKLKISITINDYGFLNYIYKNELDMEMEFTIGRLLCRQKTDNVTSHLIDGLPEQTYQHFCTPVAIGNGYNDIIKKYNITHIEIENTFQEINLPDVFEHISIILLYPYVNVASTRLCPYFLEHNEKYLFVQSCSKECNNKKLFVSDAVQGDYVYINNALSYINKEIAFDKFNFKVDILLDESWR